MATRLLTLRIALAVLILIFWTVCKRILMRNTVHCEMDDGPKVNSTNSSNL